MSSGGPTTTNTKPIFLLLSRGTDKTLEEREVPESYIAPTSIFSSQNAKNCQTDNLSIIQTRPVISHMRNMF